MKRIIFTILAVFVAYALTAQTDVQQLQSKITTLESSNAKLNSQIKGNQKAITDLTIQLQTANENIVALQAAMTEYQMKVEALTADLDKKITETEKSSTEQYEHLGKSLSQNTIFWIIAFLAVGLVSYLLYRKLRGRLSKEKAAIYNEIKSGNDQLKTDFSALITKNADDLKFMFTGELKDMDEKHKKLLSDIRTDMDAKITSNTEKMETELKSLKAEKNKAKTQPKAEIS